ncbi:flagellar hook protein FlgE [Thioalkalivibrio sp.]|uniref:flagellar hook protein FlgE n=1 Tax=Thioalkalivibrio sp. TaxID=2093813 RepID=UPI0039761B66
MPFRTALSGLNAASADLRVTGNNVANAGTVGFKESRAEFADVFALSFGGISQTAVGTGTRLAAVTQQFSQGNIDFTGNNLDLALNGQGFFVLDDGGSRVYSRAGAFQADREGFVVNAQGQRLLAFGVNDTGERAGDPQPLQLSTEAADPRATNEIIAQLNLSADAPPVAGDFDINEPNTYNHSTSLTVFDSLGTARSATLYFRNEEAEDGWQVLATIDGYQDGAGDPEIIDLTGADRLRFDASGRLEPDVEGNLTHAFPDTVFSTGADFGPDNAIEFDLTGITQFGDAFNVNRLNQDGFATGRLDSINIDPGGVVSAQFTNGQSRALGKIALANFANPQGLAQLGDNGWAESFTSGEPLLGEAGEGSLGLVQSGGLETSNVDIAQQLVNLITAQRNFQANAQVITTADTVTQTIINIR